jgi:hypothetical protein
VSSLAACYEPNAQDLPLNAMRRVAVRKFASGIQFALRLEKAPDADDITARLYDVRH